MGDSYTAVFCENEYDRKPEVLSEHSPSKRLLRGNRFFSTNGICCIEALPCRPRFALKREF